MAFDLTGLAAHIEANKTELALKSTFGAQTIDKIFRNGGNIVEGVKGQTAINVITTDAQFQALDCADTYSGTTAITRRMLTPGGVKVREKLCYHQFSDFWTKSLLMEGAADDPQSAFVTKFTEGKIAQFSRAAELALWQGDTTSVNDNLNKFDGLIKLIDASTSWGSANEVTAAITSSNILDKLNDAIDLIPTEITTADDLVIIMSIPRLRLFQRAAQAANWFNYNAVNQTGSLMTEMMHPSGIPIVGLAGLGSSVRSYILRKSNLYLGVDLSSDMLNVSLLKNPADSFYVYEATARFAVNIAFPDQVVRIKGAN